MGLLAACSDWKHGQCQVRLSGDLWCESVYALSFFICLGLYFRYLHATLVGFSCCKCTFARFPLHRSRVFLGGLYVAWRVATAAHPLPQIGSRPIALIRFQNNARKGRNEARSVHFAKDAWARARGAKVWFVPVLLIVVVGLPVL